MYIVGCAKPHVTSIVVRSPDSSSINLKILFDTSTGNKRRVLDVTSIASFIGRDTYNALPSFHAFTGCDTTSALVRKGKKIPFSKMRKNEGYLRVFADFGKSGVEVF